jgi:hypothetical protein
MDRKETIMKAPGKLPEVQEHIDKNGQSIIAVMGDHDGPGFAYTIGNAIIGLPELLIIGNYDPRALMSILNRMGDMQRAAGKPLEGDIDLGGKFPARTRPVTDSLVARGDYTIQAGQYLDREDYAVSQVLLCDKDGHYPGEPDCDPLFNVPLV